MLFSFVWLTLCGVSFLSTVLLGTGLRGWGEGAGCDLSL